MRALGIALVLLSLALAGCGGGSASSCETTSSQPGTTVSEESTASGLRTVTIDASNGEKVSVRVEIADDLLEQVIGLRGRKNLAENRGMLFVYTEEGRLTFVMEDTLIPLSIAFMDSEGRIVDIQDMKPLDGDPPHYVSAKPAQYALEVNRGFFEERGIKVGDCAELPV